MESPAETPSLETRNDQSVVLLVDDQPFEADLLRGLFENERDVAFHSCVDHREAVEMANRIRPTVILQDIMLPGGHGLAMVAAFRANPATRDTPIVIFSGLEEAKTKNLAFEMGANDYVEKSANRSELVARVRYHTKTCITQRQRDEAYRALRENERQLAESNASLLATNQKLGEALAQVKQLRGLLPMCSYCQRVRDDQNYWSEVAAYLAANSDLRVAHGVCFDCFEKQGLEKGYSREQIVAAAAKLGNRAKVTVAPLPKEEARG